MDSFESICSAMKTLKAYMPMLDKSPNIRKELISYATALDEHRSMLDEFLRECFITTSESYGLETREKLVGDEKSDYTPERRRNMLILRNTLGENDFTKAGMGRFLSCFGVTNFSLTEMPEEKALAVYIDGDYTKSERLWIESQVNMMLPVHLDCTIEFRGISWSEIDGNNMTFKDMDSRNYSWKDINNLT